MPTASDPAPTNGCALLEPTLPAARPAGQAEPTVPSKLCLILLFNHRFEGNLSKLEWVYGKRFKHIRYLMPFYRGDRPDVFPVYHSSYQFQAYFLEAWKRLKGEGFTHFLFCADDMILHPGLNDENFRQMVGIDTESGFTKELTPLLTRGLGWHSTASALVAVAGKNGVNWEKELPSAEAAAANLAAKGHPVGPIGWSIFKNGVRPKGFFQFLFYLALRWQQRRRQPAKDFWTLPYPLLAGGADLILVPAAYMEKFTHYCSVLAAMGVFVEIATPTALALSCPRVVCEAETGWVSHDHWFGRDDLWQDFCRSYDFRLDRLLAGFKERTLCEHPIKLSQWTHPS